MTLAPPRSIHLPRVGHKAPIPLGARVGSLIWSSAIAGKDPATGDLPADVQAQVANAFANMRALLQAGGASLADVVRLTVTQCDEAVRAPLNAHWLECFPDPADRPARHVLTHPLQHGMWLQLEVVALVQQPDRDRLQP